MAKKKPEFDAREWWQCESCGKAHEGKNPPDVCDYCGHQWFDNLADQLNLLGDVPEAQA